MERRYLDPPSERDLIADTVNRLQTLLPSGWRAEITGGMDLFADETLQVVAPDGRRATLAVQAKTLISPRDVQVVAQQALGSTLGVPLLCARYLSPRTRAALADRGVAYADITGNMRIVLVDPALVVITTGADNDPYRTPDRPTNSLRGAPAAKVVRALVDVRPPWTMRELATEAQTSLASTARTVEFLDREALVNRNSAGSVVDVDWEGLLRRWAEDYELGQKRRVFRCVVGRGLAAVEEALRGSDLEYVISGSMAAQRLVPYAEARLGLIYAQSAQEVMTAVGAREAPSRANLLVVEPASRKIPDDVVFIRSQQQAGLRFAGVSQVAVDLLAGPGRNPRGRSFAALDGSGTGRVAAMTYSLIAIAARRTLLDALQALEAHRDALVLVGAQAIYLYTGDADVEVATTTKDSDLVIIPDLLGDAPLIAAALEGAGFHRDLLGHQGMWLSGDEIPVDLLVPQGYERGSHRGARIPPHDKRDARRVPGLEAAAVDYRKMVIEALEAQDPRSIEANVAGPAALLVAKMHKIGERVERARKGGRDRSVGKDAHDVFRPLTAEPADYVVAGLRLGLDAVIIFASLTGLPLASTSGSGRV